MDINILNYRQNIDIVYSLCYSINKGVIIINKIIYMAEFSKNFKELYRDYTIPNKSGTFIGTLQICHWTTHRHIHSFWLLDDDSKFNCILFPEKNWLNIQQFDINDKALLLFEKTSNNSFYLRSIDKIEKKRGY